MPFKTGSECHQVNDTHLLLPPAPTWMSPAGSAVSSRTSSVTAGGCKRTNRGWDAEMAAATGLTCTHTDLHFAQIHVLLLVARLTHGRRRNGVFTGATCHATQGSWTRS
jgi:hypothetical protein